MLNLSVKSYGCQMDGWEYFASGPLRAKKKDADADLWKLKADLKELSQLRTELAATQLQLKEAREALEDCAGDDGEFKRCCDTRLSKPHAEWCHIGKILSRPADTTALNRYVAGATETAWAQAKRLAMELECLLLSSKDTAAVSKWWDSAHDALEEYRRVSADELEEK